MHVASHRLRHAAQIGVLSVAALQASTGSAAEATRVPLVEGTVYTYAAAFPRGDEEHVVRMVALDDAGATFEITFSAVGRDGIRDETLSRRVRREDLAGARRLNPVFQSGDPDRFAGATVTQLSAVALGDLRTAGRTDFILAGVKGYAGMGRAGFFTSATSGRKYFRGVLERVPGAPAHDTLPVLLNGVRTALPVVASQGNFTVAGESIRARFWWLDEPGNALLLKSEVDGSHSQLVRIDLPAARPQATALAAGLQGGGCRANLDGLYFDTGSAHLRPASRPALQAVASLLQAQPAWRLSIVGHTDSVGGAEYNRALSLRRSSAVRDALVADFRVPAERLSATGLGAAAPVAGNDTLEGRAQNRRVELTRPCPPIRSTP